MTTKKKTKKVKKEVPSKLVEVARSYSFKLNVGNYESRDFFCSQKAECLLKNAEKVSEALYQFCKQEVIKSVNEYKASVPDKINTKQNALQSAELDTEEQDD